jgi:hypothetical protein
MNIKSVYVCIDVCSEICTRAGVQMCVHVLVYTHTHVYICGYKYTYNVHVRMYTFKMNMGHPGPTMAGTPLLNIPAFLVAISSTVDPRMRVWSSAVVRVCGWRREGVCVCVCVCVLVIMFAYVRESRMMCYNRRNRSAVVYRRGASKQTKQNKQH